MTLKTKVVGLLQYAQGDDVQTYLQRWLPQSLRLTDGLFDPVTGHTHSGSGDNGPPLAIHTKAGVPTDADFATPVDGLMVVDTTDQRLYVRCGGAWLYTPLGTPPPQYWGSP